MSVYKIAIANTYVTKTLAIDEQPLPRPMPPNVDRGAHLADVVGCADCHGEDYGGRALIDSPGYATVVAPNITPSPQGLGSAMSDDALKAALQTGLDGEQRLLWGMPRKSLLALAEDDVWALVAFVRALPPSPKTHPQNRLDFWGYIDVARRTLRLIDRTPLPIKPPKMAPTAVSLDNAAEAFGSTPKKYTAWRPLAPQENDGDFAPYVRAIAQCDACHGALAPLVGRQKAAPLTPGQTALQRCAVGRRLMHLTSCERAAILN